MTAIICTIIICATVLLCVNKLATVFKPVIPAQQSITDEELAKAYKEAEADKVPDFQEVINFINKEFTGVTEEDYEG